MNNQYYQPIDNARRIKKPQRGGLYKIYFCPIEHVTLLPGALHSTGTMDAMIIVDAWYKLESTHYRNSYKEEPRSGDGGDYFEITLTIVMPFESKERHLLLDRLKYNRFIMLVVTPDKLVKVIGKMDNPARMAVSHTSGENPTDTAGDTLTITCISEDKPLLYTSEISPIHP